MTEGRDITASTTAEILSLLDRLPLDLFRNLSKVRGARNKWIHDLAPVPAGTAHLALEVAEDMLRLVEGLDIATCKSLSVQI